MGAIVALGVTQFAIWLLLTFWRAAITFSNQTALIGSWVGLAVLFVLYFITDQRSLEKLEFESGERQLASRVASRLTGGGFGGLAAGPKTMGSFVKVLSSILLIGPALTAGCLRLLRDVWLLLRIDPDLLAKGLLQLAKSQQRVPLSAMAKDLSESQAKSLMTHLSLVDGVVIRGGKNAGLTLTDALLKELRLACEARGDAE